MPDQPGKGAGEPITRSFISARVKATMPGFGLQVSEKGFRSHSPEQVFSDEAILQAAFGYFRKLGFPYRTQPLHVCFQEVNKLARTESSALLESTTGYLVADTYHPHRYHGCRHDSPKGLSPYEAFEDDERLRTCLAKTLKLEGKIKPDFIDGLRYVAGLRPPFNFRPGFALYLYRRFCKPGDVVLDTSTGYGGRLVGFFASECGKYIGIDPNTKTHEGNLRMARDFGRERDVKLFNRPAEDMTGKPDVADFAFTSPPYFATEIYSTEPTQSCHRYKTGNAWKEGFLEPTMRLQFYMLKPGCIACVNIADVKIGSDRFPLVKWTIDSAKLAGFKHEGTKRYNLRRHLGRGNKGAGTGVRYEAVLIFRKERTC